MNNTACYANTVCRAFIHINKLSLTIRFTTVQKFVEPVRGQSHQIRTACKSLSAKSKGIGLNIWRLILRFFINALKFLTDPLRSYTLAKGYTLIGTGTFLISGLHFLHRVPLFLLEDLCPVLLRILACWLQV
jgi:hypothetical protein